MLVSRKISRMIPLAVVGSEWACELRASWELLNKPSLSLLINAGAVPSPHESARVVARKIAAFCTEQAFRSTQVTLPTHHTDSPYVPRHNYASCKVK